MKRRRDTREAVKKRRREFVYIFKPIIFCVVNDLRKKSITEGRK